MVAWLSSIEKKNLNYCGKLVLTGDMSELSITKVDLSNMNTLEGKLSCCPIGGEASGPHPPWEPFQESSQESPFLLILPLSPPSATQATSRS